MQTVVEPKDVPHAKVDEVLQGVRQTLDALYKKLEGEPEFKKASERLAEIAEYCAWAGLNRGFPASLASTLVRLAFMRNFATKAHQPVFEFNHQVRSAIDPEEAECIERTNIHRLELGLRPLEIDFRLVVAGRKHSEEMSQKRYFSHDSPTLKLKTPWMRANRDSVRASCENIAIAASAAEAFVTWYYSAGHHKNMINKDASSIGIGSCERYWTEMLGTASLCTQHKDLEELDYVRFRYEAGKNVELIVKLAKWCQSKKLLTQAEDELERALTVEPDHKEAKALLERLKTLLPK